MLKSYKAVGFWLHCWCLIRGDRALLWCLALCKYTYEIFVDEALDAPDVSETLGHFAVFRGCVHAFVVRGVLKRIACFSGFCFTGACAVWGVANCFKN